MQANPVEAKAKSIAYWSEKRERTVPWSKTTFLFAILLPNTRRAIAVETFVDSWSGDWPFQE